LTCREPVGFCMNAAETTTGLKPATDIHNGLIPMALGLGMASGLVEGVIHMTLQRLNFLEQVWYQIFWISAGFNAVAVGLAAVLLRLLLQRYPKQGWLNFGSVFIVSLGALLPCTALALKEWMNSISILVLTLGLATGFTRWFFRQPERNARFFRRSLSPVTAVTALAFVGIQGGLWLQEVRATAKLPAASANAPDVLVIVLDTLRADHLGIYGYKRPTSPTIDRLAKEGVLFENAFSTCSYTLQSHASMLTGLYTYQHGVTWTTSKKIAQSSYPVLPETLQGLGYVTGAFSANTFWFAREHGFGRGFIHFDDYFYNLQDSVLRTAYGRIFTRTLLWRFDEDIPARKRASYTNEAVVSWMNRNSDHPAFVMINYFDVHDPYLPIEPYRHKFSSQKNPGGLINSDLHVPQDLSPAELQSEIDAYDGAISYLDEQLGNLLTELSRRTSKRELLVVITSDHGEEFKEDGGFTHGHNLHAKLIHVPLIVWQPGRLPQGVRVNQAVTNAAIPATVMDLIGADRKVFPGPSLQALWEYPEPPATWPYPMSELAKRDWEPESVPVHHGSLLSLISPTHHFIQHQTLGAKLFDRKQDPIEKHNLIDNPEMQHIVADFRKVARELCGNCPE
jgi:arylsulfatase A-like enzyme